MLFSNNLKYQQVKVVTSKDEKTDIGDHKELLRISQNVTGKILFFVLN